MFEQGAGQLNIEGAVRLAKAVRQDLPASPLLGTTLLTGATPTQQSTIDGTTFSWAQGIILDHTYAKGSNLITKYQKIYATGVVLGDATLLSSGVLIADVTRLTTGVVIGNTVYISNGVLLGDGYFFCSTGILLGDGVW